MRHGSVPRAASVEDEVWMWISRLEENDESLKNLY
jgi:hypothetical protein